MLALNFRSGIREVGDPDRVPHAIGIALIRVVDHRRAKQINK